MSNKIYGVLIFCCIRSVVFAQKKVAILGSSTAAGAYFLSMSNAGGVNEVHRFNKLK